MSLGRRSCGRRFDVMDGMWPCVGVSINKLKYQQRHQDKCLNRKFGSIARKDHLLQQLCATPIALSS